jgi:hypothetical protein
MVAADFNTAELEPHEMASPYFQAFGALLFDDVDDFWKCFVETLVVIFEVDSSDILAVLDGFAFSLLYELFGGELSEIHQVIPGNSVPDLLDRCQRIRSKALFSSARKGLEQT